MPNEQIAKKMSVQFAWTANFISGAQKTKNSVLILV